MQHHILQTTLVFYLLFMLFGLFLYLTVLIQILLIQILSTSQIDQHYMLYSHTLQYDKIKKRKNTASEQEQQDNPGKSTEKRIFEIL